MSNIECPHYGDNVPDLQQSIVDAPSEDFFNDPTINQGYQYLLASIKNSAKYETDSQKLKEMHTYLVRLYALLNAYKATLESTADDSTRATLSTQLEQFQIASDAISTGYDNYADMPQWKKDAAFWGSILLGIVAGLLIGAAMGAFVCALNGVLLVGLAGLAVIATNALIDGILGGCLLGGLAAEDIKNQTKPPRATFFQIQDELTAKFTTQPAAEVATEESTQPQL